MLIDATLKHDMPSLALPAEKYMTHAKAIWEELGLPRLSPQSPWHGYELRRLDGGLVAFCRDGGRGRWRELGEATHARRRDGLRPETPVREAEGRGGGHDE